LISPMTLFKVGLGCSVCKPSFGRRTLYFGTDLDSLAGNCSAHYQMVG
jgi:hypothetical protein